MSDSQRLQMREDVRKIFDAAVRAADPAECVARALAGYEFSSENFDRVLIIGAGKAAPAMARAAAFFFTDKAQTTGLVITKYGHNTVKQHSPEKTNAPKKNTQGSSQTETAHVKIVEAGHPVPDSTGVEATSRMLKMATEADEKTLVVTVISGGGSALMVAPAKSISLEDIRKTTESLLACGATIGEINIFRKHLSAIKGGQLARAIFPATTLSLILSDVIGDPLDTIASGPTTGDNSSFFDASYIVDKYSLEQKLPKAVSEHINKGCKGKIADTPSADDPMFDSVTNILVGTNSLALEAARIAALELGYHTSVLTSTLRGEAREVAKVVVALAEKAAATGPACLILGGETTVTLEGKGKGGRNQELALAAALELAPEKQIVILSCGTDGGDGPTDAAGGVADWTSQTRAGQLGVNLTDFLSDNDSYRALKKMGDLVITGPTGTNVMDVVVVLTN